MIYINISPETLADLRREHSINPHPRVRQRMFTLFLLGMGFASHDLICKIVGISPNTLRSYIKLFNKDGIDGLRKLNHWNQESKLVAYTDIIRDELNKNPVFTINQACEVIETVTGIKRKPTQTSLFINKIGFKHLKLGGIPAKAIDDVKKKSKMILKITS